ncbi:hypothetical protein Cni_G10246 [Canna indica]|uniref:BPS1-like protein n=1 Tax=Canna indica TaxID=4628 RepID=A0AAQ3Q8E4_9LILI|nr:hypothetical protein Cni_G10246 [Canna indica]
MRKSALTCFRYRGQFPLLTEDASTFCSSLAEDLKRLELSLAKDSVSLKWSVEAMSLLKRMQVKLLALLKKSKLPISYGADEDWFEQYMQESSSLLDFCNSLKSAVSGINRYCMIVELAVHKLYEEKSFSMSRIDNYEFERLCKARGKKILDACVVKETLGLNNGAFFEENGGDEKSMSIVMFAARTTMIVLSWLLVSAMVSPIQLKFESRELSSSVPELKQCMEILMMLSGCFSKNIGLNQGVCLVEHEMVNEAVEELQAQVEEKEKGERFLNGLEKLRRRSFELKEGIDRFSTVVDEVFKEVIRGRNEMLDMFRNESL